MDKTVHFEGRDYKVFVTKTQYGTYPLIVMEGQYGNGSLGLEVISCEDIGGGHLEPADMFGVITVNLCVPNLGRCQFVKNYGENSGWAEALAVAIGGKKTDVTQQTGFVTVPLYDFSALSIYAE